MRGQTNIAAACFSKFSDRRKIQSKASNFDEKTSLNDHFDIWFLFLVFNYISENKVAEDFCRILWREILKFLLRRFCFSSHSSNRSHKIPFLCHIRVLAALLNYRNREIHSTETEKYSLQKQKNTVNRIKEIQLTKT